MKKHKKKCLNCGATCTGEYCQQCGQKTTTKRFQIKEMLASVFTSLIGDDSKLWITCTCLLSRPGHMIREFLLGKRVSYYSPMPLLICLVALYAIATFFFTDAVSPFDVVRLNMTTDTVNSSSTEVFLSYYQTILENNVYFALFSVLISVLPYRYAFQNTPLPRPEGTPEPLNVAEHFFALIYQTCFNLILAFLLIPFSGFEDGKTWLARICFVMPTIYCIILYRQLLSISWRKSIRLNLQAIVLSLCMNAALILFIFGILYGIDSIR